MEKIIQEIEAEFAPVLTEKLNALNIAQADYALVQQQYELKKAEAQRYYDALNKKLEAENIILATQTDIVSKFESIGITKNKATFV